MKIVFVWVAIIGFFVLCGYAIYVDDKQCEAACSHNKVNCDQDPKNTSSQCDMVYELCWGNCHRR